MFAISLVRWALRRPRIVWRIYENPDELGYWWLREEHW